MNPENAIEVKNVRKTFRIFMDKGHTLKELALFRNRRRYENKVVLDGISFSVKKGEAIGLIGKNGCGKSTTLKLLTRIMYPDSGTIEMSGRVSSLLELGAGFHPDMTGRENIYINASIFGLTKKEIDERVSDIIKFSELEDYIDNPVRTYSSGMYMRLAFSVAINVNADILLIDEILAVGDVNFQEKCFNKMREIKGTGTTIVIVSHSLAQIEQICDRCLWLNEGRIVMDDLPQEVGDEYLEFMKGAKKIRSAEERAKARETSRQRYMRHGNGKARFLDDKICMLNAKGEDVRVFDTEEPVTLRLPYECSSRVPDTVLGFGLFRSDGIQIHGTNTHLDKVPKFEIRKNGVFEIKFDKLGVLPGEYWFDLTIESWEGIPVDYWRKAIEFEVVSSIKDFGTVRTDHSWEINKDEFLKAGESVTPITESDGETDLGKDPQYL